MKIKTSDYDTIVIGGGHAGCEAALASARLGCRTVIFTLNIDTIALMSCNPAIGGPAKGQMVGEIDALGGEMGYAADMTHIQMKVLNRSRGPAVQCLRAQSDKYHYNQHLKNVLLQHANVDVKQGIIKELMIENDTVTGVITDLDRQYFSKCVVICTGTFLNGKIFIGLKSYSAGRFGEFSAEQLTDSLKRCGLQVGRLKTGTPPRLDGRTIDYSQLTVQPGDPEFLRFSLRTPYHERYQDQVNCYLTRTTPYGHEVILKNLDRSPLFQKVIKGIGPRYCPSIEDKVYRFKDKIAHQIFIEPEGRHTTEVYPQGMNTSMPEDVQEAVLHDMKGLEKVKILKPGYAVEYDFVFPDQVTPILETKKVKNLFLAGQINGTSGYEEAGGQGLVAGANAALRALNKPSLALRREDSYIGTMIDDLIHKEIFEPYRMMTSRSEYRLILRQDNAVFRLGEKAYKVGLISKSYWDQIQGLKNRVEGLLDYWKKCKVKSSFGKVRDIRPGSTVYELVKRPEVTGSLLAQEQYVCDEEKDIVDKAVTEIKYEGYLIKQKKEIERMIHFESKKIPDTLEFSKILGLKEESREKFIKFRPKTIYDARRIAGINPTDLGILLAYLR